MASGRPPAGDCRSFGNVGALRQLALPSTISPGILNVVFRIAFITIIGYKLEITLLFERNLQSQTMVYALMTMTPRNPFFSLAALFILLVSNSLEAGVAVRLYF